MVHPALAGGPRHDGCGGRRTQGPLRPPADPADIVPRSLAVGSAAVPNHERPQHHSALPVLRSGVPAAERPADHGGDRHPARDVLAAGRGGAGVDRAGDPDRPALRARVHPALAPGAGSGGPRRDPRRGVRAGPARGEVVRSRGPRLSAVRRAGHQALRDSDPQGLGVGEVLDAAGDHPQRHADHRPRIRRLRGRPRPDHPRHPGCVHHHDAVAGVADRVVGLPVVDDPGVDDRRQPHRRDLRRTAGDHRRRRSRRAPRRPAGAARRRLPLPGQ